MKSYQLLITTAQDFINYHLLFTGLILISLVQTYYTSLTEHYPEWKKCVHSDFERGLLGLYIVVEGCFCFFLITCSKTISCFFSVLRQFQILTPTRQPG
jgi:hypothetical protein